MQVVVIVLAIVAAVAVVAWFFANRKHPERASDHPGPPRTGSAQFHGDVDDRPAGPGAEADGGAGPGEPTPGPGAESPPSRRDL